MATPGDAHIGRQDTTETRTKIRIFRGWFEPSAASSTTAPPHTDLPAGWKIAHTAAGTHVLTLPNAHKKIVSATLQAQLHDPTGSTTQGMLVTVGDTDVVTAKTIKILFSQATVVDAPPAALTYPLTDIPAVAGIAGNRIFFEFALSSTDVPNQ